MHLDYQASYYGTVALAIVGWSIVLWFLKREGNSFLRMASALELISKGGNDQRRAALLEQHALLAKIVSMSKQRVDSVAEDQISAKSLLKGHHDHLVDVVNKHYAQIETELRKL